jgi:hypothetical protein
MQGLGGPATFQSPPTTTLSTVKRKSTCQSCRQTAGSCQVPVICISNTLPICSHHSVLERGTDAWVLAIPHTDLPSV